MNGTLLQLFPYSRVVLCCKLYPKPFPTRSSVTERTPTDHRPTSTPGFQACWCRHSAISPANYRLTAAVLGAASPTRCQGRAWRRCIEHWRSIVENRLIPDHRWNHRGVSSKFLMKSFDDFHNGRIPFVARKLWDVKRSRVSYRLEFGQYYMGRVIIINTRRRPCFRR